jgi:hypothetical protein
LAKQFPAGNDPHVPFSSIVKAYPNLNLRDKMLLMHEENGGQTPERSNTAKRLDVRDQLFMQSHPPA